MYKFFILLTSVWYVSCNYHDELESQLMQEDFVTKRNVTNVNVERTIDITSQLVKITSTLTLQNNGLAPAEEVYILSSEPDVVGTLAYISAKDADKKELKVLDSNVGDVLRIPVKTFYPGETTTLTVERVFTNAILPYPKSIGQKDKQMVQYFGNVFYYSVASTAKQTTTVIVNSRNVEMYTRYKPVTQSDSAITYGPYHNVKPFARERLMVHYENNSPFLTVTYLNRHIEISHWGNIAVEENIEILHTGAKLKGPFSRYDYQRDTSSSHHSVKSYKTILPASAHSIYYRDSNGNISTSLVRTRKDWIELELRPRFPLFGGWRTSYTLGYSVPSYQYLYRKSDNKYVLNMRLLDHVFDDMHVQELETSVILPVGASDPKISLPYDVEILPNGTVNKYLDYYGRTVINLKKHNLVEQHIQDFELTYHWSAMWLLYEPALLAAILFIMFVVVIIYVRLDFSIHKTEKTKVE